MKGWQFWVVVTVVIVGVLVNVLYVRSKTDATLTQLRNVASENTALLNQRLEALDKSLASAIRISESNSLQSCSVCVSTATTALVGQIKSTSENTINEIVRQLQPEATVRSASGVPAISGIWLIGPSGTGGSCSILQDGNRLRVTNERGDSASAVFTGARSFETEPNSGWGRNFGDLNEKLDVITWRHGGTWVKKVSPFTVNGLNDGLVAYYPFNGNADDEGGNGQHGHIVNVVLAPDRFGNSNHAYDFTGTGSYVGIPAASIDNLRSGTISAWINPRGLTGTITAKQHDSVDSQALLTIGYIPHTGAPGDGVPGRIYFRGSNRSGQASSISTLNTGSWYHVAVVFSASSAKIYINGNLDATTSGNYSGYSDLNTVNTIGGWLCPPNPSFWFDGLIDEVRIYNRALSASEILRLGSINSSADKGATQSKEGAVVGGSSVATQIDRRPNGVVPKDQNTVASNTCINHLRQIESAKEQWALVNHKKEGDGITKPDLIQYLKGVNTFGASGF